MTPLELLDDVKARFPILLIQDQGQLQRLLCQALLTYQEKAGSIGEFSVTGDALALDDPSITVPGNALAPIAGEDARGALVTLTERTTDAGEDWQLGITNYHIPPYKIRYFVDFVGMDYAADRLPRGTAGTIGDYLYALVDIVNTQRQRQVNQASEIPADHLRSDAELHQAKAELEQAMVEELAIIPSIVAA